MCERGVIPERPAGINGSVHYYHRVHPYENHRYEKVLKAKSQLLKIFLVQVLYQLLVAAFRFLSPLKDDILYQPCIFSIILGSISLIIGEIGRQCSRVDFLTVLYIGSFISLLISLLSVARHVHLILDLEYVSESLKCQVSILAIVALFMTDSTCQLLETTSVLMSNM